MKTFAKNFLQGLLVLVPIVVTGYVVWRVVTAVDGWLRVPIPGIGLIVTVLGITTVGFLGSNVVGRKIFGVLEGAITKLPVVQLVYVSIRDLLNAFVGERRRFGKPVMIDVSSNTSGEASVRVFGFVTCERFDDPRLSGFVAVYLPQPYNFSGNLLIVTRDRVHPIDAEPAQFLAFVVSGGVAEMHAARTVMEVPGKSAS